MRKFIILQGGLLSPHYGASDVSGGVWISSMLSNYLLGDKPGLRAKFRGKEWEPARHELDAPGHELMAVLNRYGRGMRVDREEMPEAAAVWNEQRFKRMHDLSR